MESLGFGGSVTPQRVGSDGPPAVHAVGHGMSDLSRRRFAPTCSAHWRRASAGGGTLIRLRPSASRVPPPLAVSRAQTGGTPGIGGSEWGHLPMVAHLVRGQGAAARRLAWRERGRLSVVLMDREMVLGGESLPLASTRKRFYATPSAGGPATRRCECT